MARIELQNLRKEFGRSVVAVKDLSLTIEDGEFLVMVGPSGCGKTTTLRMIAGFEDPSSGEIRMDGNPVNELEPGDRNLGMVFQSHALFPHKTVAQNIEFGPRMQKVDPETRRRRVREVAAMVRITHLLDKMPGQCSGGESQRVALARTLITDPGTFLLDEPLSSLDAKLRREMRAEVDRLHQELRKTFIYVTHDQEEAMTLADRIVVMRAGEIEQVGTPLEIYSDPVSLFVADFFGSPSMNLIPGRIENDAGSAVFAGERTTIALPPAFAEAEPGPGTLGIRPEHLAVGGAGEIVEKIHLVEPLGKDTLLYFDYGGEQDLIAIVDGVSSFRAGTELGVRFTPEHLFLFGEDGRRIGRAH